MVEAEQKPAAKCNLYTLFVGSSIYYPFTSIAWKYIDKYGDNFDKTLFFADESCCSKTFDVCVSMDAYVVYC